ncbi:phage terminase large subunit [Vibrio sp. YMD68]|uniref:phage terminase large subunit n=1 Tax=Vibrio sp. YMD68 TaxID=3042300 RepID=UPI00249A238A|nr:phage terminase large subunit [Vibrio sp. YMD68]WGV98852.1 phage terminase large subunit [Vibrio sp. YMD68]WGW01221.1 phage terminase large subunit [Vibrio sp. YMD68]
MKGYKKLSQREYEKELEAQYQAHLQLIETECKSFKVNKAESKKRVLQCNDVETGFRFFCMTYFPHIMTKDPSAFHEWCFQHLPAVVYTPGGQKQGLAAPRGEAKSTYVTVLFNLYCTLLELKWYTIIIMETNEQSAEKLAQIKAELIANPRLGADFPHSTGQGPTWAMNEIITANNRKIVAGGIKMKRGRNHGHHRPDLLLLDDLENDENVKSKEFRDKLENWLKKTAFKYGPPDGSMDIFYAGTVLHYDSVLNRFMKKPTWKKRAVIFKAIIEWPKRMDLWEAWEEILLNDDDGEDKAWMFYCQRKKEMDEGAIVSWPAMRSLYQLMLERSEDHEAFESEFQNTPGNAEDQPFKEIRFWVHPDPQWVFYGACDPALGKNKKACPAAVLVGGINLNAKRPTLNVIEADIARMTPTVTMHKIIEFQKEYHCMVFGVESIGFQDFMRTELIGLGQEMRVPVPARAVMPTGPMSDKDLRIMSLEPHVRNGLILLHRNLTTLTEQMRYYPESTYKDGPDCLHMLWTLAMSGARGIPRVLSGGRSRLTIDNRMPR